MLSESAHRSRLSGSLHVTAVELNPRSTWWNRSKAAVLVGIVSSLIGRAPIFAFGVIVTVIFF